MPSEWDYYSYGTVALMVLRQFSDICGPTFRIQHSTDFSISVKRIRYGFSTSFYDKNYLPVSYSNIIIPKTHLNPTKPS
jgi:hypothetical protein